MFFQAPNRSAAAIRLDLPLRGGGAWRHGATHDWTLSRRIRDSVGIPVFLAGGLNPGNVSAAIAAVQPFGINLCSSVRTDDILHNTKLRALFATIETATI